MKLNKALKVKNRIVNELNILQDIIRSNNTFNENSQLQYDSSVEYKKYINKLSELIKLKANIQKANSGISLQLTEQAELKSTLTFLRTIPVRIGIENQGYGDNLVTINWKSHLDNKFLREETDSIQNRINLIQDEIDEYNSVTDI